MWQRPEDWHAVSGSKKCLGGWIVLTKRKAFPGSRHLITMPQLCPPYAAPRTLRSASLALPPQSLPGLSFHSWSVLGPVGQKVHDQELAIF